MNPRCIMKVSGLYIVDTDYSANKTWKIIKGNLKMVESRIRKSSSPDRYIVVPGYAFSFVGPRCLTKREDLSIMFQAGTIKECKDWINAWVKERG